MKFIIGIGNPEKKYERTRHNIGIQVFETIKTKNRLASSELFKGRKLKNASIAKFDDNTYLFRPKIYVNNSGSLITEISEKSGKNVEENEFLIVCDDANLDFGKMRLRESGSAGGHHGLESIIQERGTEDFARLRVGIRSGAMPRDLAPYVLDEFDGEEEKVLPKILEKAALVCEVWAKEGFQAAQNRLSQLQSVNS